MSCKEYRNRNYILSFCKLPTKGLSPKGRVGGCCFSLGKQIFLYGGVSRNEAYSDLWQLDISTCIWKELQTEGFSKPSARFGHSWAMVPEKGVAVVFGGFSNRTSIASLEEDWSFYLSEAPLCCGRTRDRGWCHHPISMNDLHILNMSTLAWSQVPFVIDFPSKRGYHATAVVDQRIIIHGGYQDEDKNVLGDMHLLEVETNKWHPVEQDGTVPTPRYGHGLAFGSKFNALFLFGGTDTDSNLYMACLSDSFGLDLKITWRVVSSRGFSPPPRRFHSLQLIGGKLVLYGGMDVYGLSEVYLFDCASQEWNKPLYDGIMRNRSYASAGIGDKIICFGGCSGGLESLPFDGSGDPEEKSGQCITSDKNDTAPLALNNELQLMTILELNLNSLSSENKFKVVVLGDCAVGKTSLLSRFAQDCFSEFHVSTIGVDYKAVAVMVKGRLVTLHLWDTAGQERFSGITGNYYRNTHAFVVVVDATRRETFDNVYHWFEQINDKASSEDRVHVLLVNKCDLVESIQVTYEEAKVCAEKHNALLVATSAKTAANVDFAFLNMAKQLIVLRNKNTIQPWEKTPGMSLQPLQLDRGSCHCANLA